jgi:cardiolipin synthase
VTRKDIPNLISILRMALAVPVVVALLTQRFELALTLFLVAGISDGLDGFLAKQYGWSSRLGGLLDPLADKLLLVTALLALAWLGAVPVWLVAIVLLRDVVIVTGAAVYNYRITKLEAKPTLLSKINTVVQIALVLAVMLNHGIVSLPVWFFQGLIWATLATTVSSGANYVWVWSRHATQLTTHH